MSTVFQRLWPELSLLPMILLCVCFFVCLFNFLSVNMSVKRCGGAYGARISRANQIATACALAAYVTKR